MKFWLLKKARFKKKFIPQIKQIVPKGYNEGLCCNDWLFQELYLKN